ncbi:hypothetical protein Mag101_15250 [Microbulbifer agarilyticus]|uniref:Uncharacterized protein n=1 Tax=Microbulbifer agarilyticus TaxID=260552 RepID=A0A1Q2M820_9GAMM|nr:hypothetical protein [Microbulbifer agarilyticus]AQQ68836.1 hypothetical protein Mag101_15250 [Microbulbifer agarilyticus]
MGRFSRHFEVLTQAISGMGSAGDTAVAEAPTAEAAVSEEGTSAPDSSIEQALLKGMEVTLGDLDQTEHGWMYRGHPVMVYAVDVAAVDDPQVRKEFFHRIHLASCCGALEVPDQVVWIGTAREALAAPGLESAPHVCEHCLAKVNHRGYRSLGPRDRKRVAEAFNFQWHVSQYAQEFFAADAAHFWAPGKQARALEQIEPDAADSGTCGFCEWQVPAGNGWFVPVQRGMELGLSVDSCVLCAQQQAMGVLTLPDDSALAASQARCVDQESAQSSSPEEASEDERSWTQVRRQLPLSWHPLCEQLERSLSAPVLFQRFTGYEGVAVLAWPEHRRGIVASAEDRELLPEGWDFWIMQDVLGSLG